MELGLPGSLSAKEQNYLAQVLTITVNGEQYPWAEAIRCQEGQSVWYKLVTTEPRPSENETIGFKFDHLWWDYETTEKLLRLSFP